ncbi:fam-a protein [Plasmodium chabaudi chabaudi]|uniref:Fam-a protein n=1 Tax=Plasmodium chabaudi chabaudi TaxID=31271 RepID=A0A4V0K260_PLACU|nr:fam-a protein [Plasmodium chabaudi chabaudi]VTZ66915.1 fam-a protein [Plasmodium chabaudi chabaudi]|eukprot:XP_016653125.1 fam-a protein [Plasmodium chabaudi chabaudi]
MNNGYVKIIFFVLILFVYVNDKVLTTEYVAGNSAPPEQTRAKEGRANTSLFETDQSEESSFETDQSEESLFKTDPPEESLPEITLPKETRRKRVRYTKTRPQNIPSESSSSETHLFITPRRQKPRSKRTRYKATLSKTPSSKTILPEIAIPETAIPEIAIPETVSPETALPETVSPETVLPQAVSPETVLPETVPPETALPQAVLTNAPSSHIAYTPASFKLDKIYKKIKNLLCTNPAETKKAIEVMDEAVQFLKYYATTKAGYKYHSTSNDGVDVYYRNNGNNAYVEKCKIKISNSNRYDDIIYMLWDPNGPRKFDPNFINGKAVRSYNRNLFMVLKLYKNATLSSERYFYALAKKVHISEDTTIIVMSSGNINDHNSFNIKTFKNKIVESMNSFKTSVDLDDDIKNRYYKKTFAHLSGYLIKKKDDHVDVTFVNSMDFNPLIPLNWVVKNANIEAMKSIIYLKHYFNN